MLEQQILLLQPWSASTQPNPHNGAIRTIRDAATHTPLGFACWRSDPRPWWLRWLASPVLEVRETEDEPLLCTVHRLWGLTPRWQVRDADGHRVGKVRGKLLQDRYERSLAVVESFGDNSATRFRHPQGHELGTLTSCEEGARLRFAPTVEEEPFVKMVLLAAALVSR